MADTKDLQPVEGGVILDALAKLLFGSLDNIFDAAVEYQKEMGVLKQINKVQAKDKNGNEYTCTIKLAPIKNHEGTYFIEISCEDANGKEVQGFKDLGLNEKGIKLDKSNENSFKNKVDEILEANGFTRIEGQSTKDESGQQEKKTEQKVDEEAKYFHRHGPFIFIDKEDEDKTYKVYLEFKGDPKKREVQVSTVSVPRLPENYKKVFSWDDSPVFTKAFLNFVDANSVIPDTQWDDEIEALDDGLFRKIIEEFEDTVEQDKKSTAASIRVTLEKVTANGHEDINLISINCAKSMKRSAMRKIQDIVECDEFIDSMPEGESSYIISEDDEFYDVQCCND